MKKLLHDLLGWGFNAGLAERDEYGFQDTYKCRYCDNAIMQDSQGNWFHLSKKLTPNEETTNYQSGK